MPTDFDWKKYRKQQAEPEPPEESTPPKGMVWIFNVFFYVMVGFSILSLWNYTTESSNILKILDNCAEQKGIAVRTLRGDAVCIREDVLTQVLKNSDKIKQ